jgi:hypothetical protein
MNTGGWIIMILMWSGIFGVAAFCFHRVLTDKTEPGGAKDE